MSGTELGHSNGLMSGHSRPGLDQAHHGNLAMQVGPSTCRLSGIRPDQIASRRLAKERDEEGRRRKMAERRRGERTKTSRTSKPEHAMGRIDVCRCVEHVKVGRIESQVAGGRRQIVVQLLLVCTVAVLPNRNFCSTAVPAYLPMYLPTCLACLPFSSADWWSWIWVISAPAPKKKHTPSCTPHR